MANFIVAVWIIKTYWIFESQCFNN